MVVIGVTAPSAWSGTPLGQQVVLQPEHDPMVVGVGVVVAEQVQDAVHGEQLDLGVLAVAGR